MPQTRPTLRILPAMLAFTLALSGCSGGNSPAGPIAPSAPSASATPLVSTGNAAVDSALNNLGDLRAALDAVRTLGAAGSSLGTAGLGTAGFAIRETGPASTPAAPPAFRDPHADQPGERIEEREQRVFDGKRDHVVKVRIKIVITQEPNRRVRRETDATNGEPGRLLSESINERLADGRVRDTVTSLFADPEGNVHKIVNIGTHLPFDPNHFRVDPNAPPPPPPDGSTEEFLSTDGGQTFVKVGEGRTDGGKHHSSRKFKDRRGVEIEETSSSDPASGENTSERKENGVVVFSRSFRIAREDGRVIIHEIEDNTFVDPGGVKRRHKANIKRLGDFFGGFTGNRPGDPVAAPATSSAPAFLNARQLSVPSSGSGQSSPGNVGGPVLVGPLPPSGGPGVPGPGPIPGIGLVLPEPNQLPVPPGTLQASIEDFENDKLVYKLEYKNDNPADPTQARIKEVRFDRETGQELPADQVTVNADGSRTVVKHLHNGNTLTATFNPSVSGPQPLEEKARDGQLVHKVERTGNTFVETFYGPPGTPRHVIRGTISGRDSGEFREFEVRDGQEVLVVIVKIIGGRLTRFGPDGTTPLRDGFGSPTTERRQVDGDTEEVTTIQEVGGKVIKLIRKIRKVTREAFAGVGSNGLFQPQLASKTDAVAGVQQVVGDGDVTIDFADDITQVDRTKFKMRFKSRLQFDGNIEKGSGQANLDGDLTTGDGRKFKVRITQTLGSVGMSGTIELITDDGQLKFSMDLGADGSGVGTVSQLPGGTRIFTISIGTNGRGVVRDKDDRPVASDVPLFR